MRRILHRLDRGLLHACEFFFGSRDSWGWWQRRLVPDDAGRNSLWGQGAHWCPTCRVHTPKYATSHVCPGAERVPECAVCVYHAPDVPLDRLRDIKCQDCGRDLSDHSLEQRASVTPGMAYAVNPDRIHSEWIGPERW